MSGLWGELALNLAICAGLVLLVVLAAFAVGVRRARHDGIDAAWGGGFAVVALATLLLSDGDGPLWRRVLVTALTVVWGVRLAWFLVLRNRGKPQDRRYDDLMARARGNPTWHAFTMIYLLQGGLIWLISLPVQFAQYGFGGWNWPVYLGVAVWVVGFVFESVGDAQLRRFTADPANRGSVMDRGLWRYTRHPNYFGDTCVWWGLFLISCQHWTGLVTAVSPIVMTVLLVQVSGKALLERTMAQRRPGYSDYVARTSGFLPLPPKRPPG